MNRAFLGLGGNLGDRLQNLYLVRKSLNQTCGRIVKTSAIYETAAWGYDSSSAYLNQVVELETSLAAGELLKCFREIESKNGRQRPGTGYQDRTMDIDLLFYNQERIETEELKVPHPRITDRRFVLQPLMDIAPDLLHPANHQTITELFNQCTDESMVRLVLDKKFPTYICIEGNIGSGKTTLAQMLAPHLKARFIPEDFQNLNLLPRFYEKPEKFSFALEFAFLLNRLEQLSVLSGQPESKTLSDYSLYKSLYFARVNLKDKALALFEKQFDLLSSDLPQPGLIVHLNTSTNQLLKNIANRSRSFEKGITEKYLKSIERSYWNCFNHLQSIPQMKIEVERYHPGLEKEHLVRIDRFLVENFADTV